MLHIALGHDPMQGLAVAVLRQAVLDWQDPDQRKDVEDFLESDAGTLFCDYLDVNPGTVLASLVRLQAADKRPLAIMRALKSAS